MGRDALTGTTSESQPSARREGACGDPSRAEDARTSSLRACTGDGRAPEARDPIGLEDLERLANPSRSLFEQQPELNGIHRASGLSALADAVGSLGAVAGISLVAAVQLLVGQEPDDLLGLVSLAAILLATGIVSALVGWRTRTWELTDDGVILRGGLMRRRCLQVPYEHIHTVNMSSSLIERIFGLMTLDLDTGAAESEGDLTRIKGLKAGMAHALREELFHRKAQVLEASSAETAERRTEDAADADRSAPPRPARESAGEPQPLARHTLTCGQLILAAATDARVAAQTFAFIILLVQGVNLLQESKLVNLHDAAQDIAALPAAILISVAGALLILSLVAGAIISFATSLIGYAGYRADRYPDRVVVERGLLNRLSQTVATERIQAVRIRQNLLRQALGYAEVRAVVVSAADSSDKNSTAAGIVLHPFIRLCDVEAFLSEVAPAYAGMIDGIQLHRLPPVAARRLVTRTLLKLATLIFALVAAHGLATLLPADVLSSGLVLLGIDSLLIVLGAAGTLRTVVQALLRLAHSRIGRDRRRAVIVNGGIRRTTTLVRRCHLQHLTVSQSPFQRRVHVSTFRTGTAARGDIALADIANADAEDLLAWYRRRTPAHPSR